MNVENRTLFHGDNLVFLRGINSESVHLIATDPPFNKNKDFHATPDSLAAGSRFHDRWSWDRDVHEEWVDAIQDDWPGAWLVINAARNAYGGDMGAFLCWLGVRLMEMHRVLREDGSIYLHIDHVAHAYVKSLMDAIFGSKNFRNEIVWCYTGPSNTKNWFPRKHDTLLFYAKSNKTKFNRDAVRIPYKRITGIGHNSMARGKRTDEEVLEIQELYEKRGKVPEDYWTDIAGGGHIPKGERTGYPTQKPLALYERIIKASSNEGDIVLDPFAGCATTPVVAERLRRQWIGIDIWDNAFEVVKQRMEDNRQLLNDIPYIIYSDTPPVRTDMTNVAAPTLRLKLQRNPEPWQRLTHKQITSILTYSQSNGSGVVCAGCGRVLEKEFMQLDHIKPRSDRGTNDILNRILLCGPCNMKKGSILTLTGLMLQNKQQGWMEDEERAMVAQNSTERCALRVRDEFDTYECQLLIHGQGLLI